MNIEDLTLKQIREIQSFGLRPEQLSEHPFKIGKCYLIRTVTMIQTGRLIAVYPQEIVLEEAAWIADTGLFSESLKSLDFEEVEPFPDGPVIVGRGSIIDAAQIDNTVTKRK